MHGAGTVATVFELRSSGLGARRIASRTGVPVATVRDWLAGRLPAHSRGRPPGGAAAGTCERCGHTAHRWDRLPAAYVYLLGMYLGDGCISEHARNVFRLRIFLDLRYPLIVDECEAAIRALAPQNKVHRLERRSNFVDRPEPSDVAVSAFSKTWPCLLPQHGPGRKHERHIALTGWQEQLVDQRPEQLIRGLIQSDGCRFMNTGRNNWVCPRYAFSQKSDDIRSIFCDACDRLGVRWTKAGDRTIYVSRKADVATLDSFIGPKR